MYFQVFEYMYFQAFKCVFPGLYVSIYVFPGLQGVEELEKDHSRPQQNKHNPTFCLQGGTFLQGQFD